MPFIEDAEQFWESHLTVFKAYIFGVLAFLLLICVGSLIHTIRGVSYKFTIILNLAVIQSIVCYIVYTS